MPVTKFPANRPRRVEFTKFTLFEKYEDNKRRRLKFDANALAAFEQETGMGFAQMMQQKALWGATRALLWAGLRHMERGLTIEMVGDLMTEYLRDEDGEHNIDDLLREAMSAMVEQGALGKVKKLEDMDDDEVEKKPETSKAIEGEVLEAKDPTLPKSEETPES